MHAVGVYSVYTHRRIVGTTFRQSETACSVTIFEKIINVTHCSSSDFEEYHHHEFQFCHEEFLHDEDDEDEVCGRFPCCSLYHFHQQCSHNLHFLRIADSEFDAFVCSAEWVCGAALFLPYTSLVVADILVLLRRNLGVVVKVVEILRHLSREPTAENIVFVQFS